MVKNDNTEEKKQEKTLSIKLPKSKKVLLPLMVILGVAIILLLISKGPITGNVSKDVAGDKAVIFLNDYLTENGEQGTATLIDVVEVSGLYEVNMDFNGEVLGVYITKDGKYIMPKAALSEIEAVYSNTPTDNTQQTDIVVSTPEEIAEFVNCLAEAGFRIYGANWCGWTQKAVDAFGGFEGAGPVYVECTEETELCQEKEVEGYPTILINGEKYLGERTFEGYAEATGCEIGAAEEVVNQDTQSTGSCN